jgi:hypothetical protein
LFPGPNPEPDPDHLTYHIKTIKFVQNFVLLVITVRSSFVSQKGGLLWVLFSLLNSILCWIRIQIRFRIMHSGDSAEAKISCGSGSAALVPRNSVSELDLGFLLNAHPDPGFFMTADLDPGLSEPKLTLRI